MGFHTSKRLICAIFAHYLNRIIMKLENLAIHPSVWPIDKNMIPLLVVLRSISIKMIACCGGHKKRIHGQMPYNQWFVTFYPCKKISILRQICDKYGVSVKRDRSSGSNFGIYYRMIGRKNVLNSLIRDLQVYSCNTL